MLAAALLAAAIARENAGLVRHECEHLGLVSCIDNATNSEAAGTTVPVAVLGIELAPDGADGTCRLGSPGG